MNSRSDHRLPSTATAPAASQTLAEAQLREASVRVTAARVKVLAALLDAGSAVTHQHLQDRLHALDRVTLYRALDCLTDAGLAHKIAGDDRVFRYGAGAEHGGQARSHPHGHFKCTRCARMFCLDDDGAGDAALRAQLAGMLRRALGDGFESHDIELTVKGRCADCAH